MKAQPLLPGLAEPAKMPAPSTRGDWLNLLEPALVARSPESLRIADEAIRALPGDSALLLMAVIAALVADQPDRAMSLVKRFEKKFVTDRAVTLLTAFALARQGFVPRAWTLLEQNGLNEPSEAIAWFVAGRTMVPWMFEQLMHVRKANDQLQRGILAPAGKPAPGQKTKAVPAIPKRGAVAGAPQPTAKHAQTPIDTIPDLPRLDINLDLTFEMAAPELSDLAHKYALRMSADWVQTQELVMPVHRLTVQVRRRKAERTLVMDWNPYARHPEPPPCEASFSAERPRLVCDAALHLVAPSGLAPCESCSRPYCRACHPQKCDKCGKTNELSAFAKVTPAPLTKRNETAH
jgi:hypothetical protein